MVQACKGRSVRPSDLEPSTYESSYVHTHTHARGIKDKLLNLQLRDNIIYIRKVVVMSLHDKYLQHLFRLYRITI